jgi:hypothetical protein
MAATVTPIRPGIVIAEPPVTPPKPLYVCPICEAPPEPSLDVLSAGCDACGVPMHSECYWGRVASIEEWRVYLHWLTSPETFGTDFTEPTRCPACRAGGKEGA